MIFVTQGRDKSAFVRKDGNIHYVDTFKVKSIDATGCGDAFMSAVLAQFLDRIDRQEGIDGIKDEELRNIVQYANGAAAIASLKLGVIPALPGGKEVEEFLKGL